MSAPRVLLHICCAPCAVHPVRVLREAGYAVTGLFYNPNIHPVAEYALRRDTLKTFAESLGIQVIFKDQDYDPREWFRRVSFREDNRCFHCYQMRLEKTSHIAKAGDFEFFSSTLLYSRRQKHEVIAELGRDLQGANKARFLYQDFREGWSEGIEESKRLNMYRQDYCGCLYSDLERRKVLLAPPRPKKATGGQGSGESGGSCPI